MARRMKGAGSLYQAQDKTWVYQYSVDGKRKTKRFQRKADAKAFIDSLEMVAEMVSERPARSHAAEVITVGEWMDRWLELYAKPVVKLSTYCCYELYIRGHIKPQMGALYMNTLRADDLQHFFNDRSKSGNLNGKEGFPPRR